MTPTLTEKPYLADLEDLKRYADTLPDSRMLAVAKITAMAVMNMRWEHIMVDREFPEHPLYNGDPSWFLPAIGAWYRTRDWIDRRLAG